MNYIGEQLFPGHAGHLFIILSLIASLAATASYFFSVQSKDADQKKQWKYLGRLFFFTEVLSVLFVFGILFYIINNHLFEYKYAWQHSSRSLETKYLLSCFWEGQEGSFLLWSVWHCILGLILIWKNKEWEAPVMAVLSFAQVILATMLAGIDLGSIQIGSNPFLLLRNSGVLDNAPAFHDMTGAVRQDYRTLITDGNDLNPLLQNYWMVIHPPVLFLGFASTVVPFAFSIAGLWTKKYTEWTKPALPWALFSAGVLGLGIMMGAAWAYESLNFGGYWAWDPVENASLVPWLVLVAGIHTLVIYKHTGNALRSTNIFFILCFLLVLYSTYLTRSGDLQDTSVHAFTGEGIAKWHLRLFLLIFLIPAGWLFIKRYKEVPYIAKEEETSSREFWMFIGAIVIFLSSVLIIAMTSIPVFNKVAALFTSKDKLFTPIAVGEEAAFAYNRIQIFVAIIIGSLSGFGMYLRYKATSQQFFKKLLWPAIIAMIASALILAFGNIEYREHGMGYLGAIWFAIVAAVFSVIANGSYIWNGFRGKLKRSGGSIAHVGFALMLLGILISSSKKEVLSYNTSGIFLNFGEQSKEKPGENLTLVEGVRTDMGKYWVTYQSDSAHPKKPLWFYKLDFRSKDGKQAFELHPNAFVNYKGNMGLMANPDAKHYLTYDIFTYITSLPDPSKNTDTTSFKTQSVNVGDTIFYSKGYLVVQDVSSYRNIPNVPLGPNDSASVATIKVMAKTGSIYTSRPVLLTKGGTGYVQPDTLTAESLVLQLEKVDGRKADIGVKESDALMKYVTLKAYKFPFIIILWLGTIIMVFGFMISMLWRREVNLLKHVKL